MTPGKWNAWKRKSGFTKITGVRSPGADSALVVVEGTGGSIARINAADSIGIAALKNHAERLIAVVEAAIDAESQMHCTCRLNKLCEKCDLLKKIERLESEG